MQDRRQDRLAQVRFQNRLQEQRLDSRLRQRLLVSQNRRYAATVRSAQRQRWQAARAQFVAERNQQFRLNNLRRANAYYDYGYRDTPRYAQYASNYGIGRSFPLSSYSAYNVPRSYQDIYYDRPDSYYRYGDGYIYNVNPYNNIVTGAVPLLGGAFAAGNVLPGGYDVYNVPGQYRSQYYDTPENFYRYGDGGIYRVDASSGIIQGIVALLAGGGFGVGNRLPSGYGAYNLPMAYRSQYVDGPDAMYRYNDGYIYQVDPSSMLITSAISALI